MSIELFLYLADVIPRVGEFFGVITLIGGLLGGLGFLPIYVEKMGTPNFRARYPFILVGFLFITGTCSMLIPSKQTIYMIAGASVAKQALNSSIGQKVQQVIEDQLDEFIKKGAK